MDVLLISFVALSTFIWFFGTKMANWLSDEDSNETAYNSQSSELGYIYPLRHQTAPQHARFLRSSRANGARLSTDRLHRSTSRIRVVSPDCAPRVHP